MRALRQSRVNYYFDGSLSKTCSRQAVTVHDGTLGPAQASSAPLTRPSLPANWSPSKTACSTSAMISSCHQATPTQEQPIRALPYRTSCVAQSGQRTRPSPFLHACSANREGSFFQFRFPVCFSTPVIATFLHPRLQSSSSVAWCHPMSQPGRECLSKNQCRP